LAPAHVLAGAETQQFFTREGEPEHNVFEQLPQN
jgi:hypothetical protein